jgi:phage terminase small subunit
MLEVGTYRPAFDVALQSAADVLEKRDAALREFVDSGGDACVEYVSDRGSVNVKKNPRLQIWMDLNNQAFSFCRDLGLTPSGLKKLNDEALAGGGGGSPLERIIQAMEVEA